MRILPLLVGLSLLSLAPVLPSQASDSAGPQVRAHKTIDEIHRDNDRMKAMNKDRAKRIKRDTDELFHLSTELKDYVDKTNENVMSVDVIKKAEQIEKLAKSIRERMKEDYRIPDNTVP